MICNRHLQVVNHFEVRVSDRTLDHIPRARPEFLRALLAEHCLCDIEVRQVDLRRVFDGHARSACHAFDDMIASDTHEQLHACADSLPDRAADDREEGQRAFRALPISPACLSF